ncbi:VCBS domain-containing protein [Massilia sp. B-10]|nr:VCBS domain-containing protein [Massilia sp. B-10]
MSPRPSFYTYGSLAIDASGAWTYTASSAHDEFMRAPPPTPTSSPSSAQMAPPAP